MKFIEAVKSIFLHFSDEELHRVLPLNDTFGYYFELTKAEERLLDEGLKNGEIHLPINDLSSNSIIRSTVLQWILTLQEEYRHVFRRGRLNIFNAQILTFAQYQNLALDENPVFDSKVFVLDLSFKIVFSNLKFHNCDFFGGLNFERTKFENLKFINSRIGIGGVCKDFFNKEVVYNPSIQGEGAFFYGDFEIIGSSYPFDSRINSFNIHAGIYFTNTTFQGNVTFQKESFKEVIDFSYSNIEILNFSFIGVISARLNLIYSKIRSIYIFHSTFLAGDLYYQVDTQQESNKWSDCDVISAIGMCTHLLRISGGCLILGKILLDYSKVDDLLRIEDTTLISGKKLGIHEDDITLSISNSVQSRVQLRNNLYSFGRIIMSHSRFENFTIFRSCFYNYFLKKDEICTCFDLSNSTVENSLIFNSKEISKTEFFFPEINSVIYNINSYLKTFKSSFLENSSKNSFLNSENLESSKLDENRTDLESTEYKNHELKELIKKVEKSILTNQEINLSAKLEIATSLKKSRTNNEIRPLQEHTIWIESYLEAITKKDKLDDKVATNYSMMFGETNLISTTIGNTLDLAGGLFYLPNQTGTKNNALDLKFSAIGSSLFINDYEKENNIPPFKSEGKVDLQSVNTNRFYINPNLGTCKETTWKIIGLKYNFIHTHDGNESKLSKCKWFENEKQKLNSRQPYEQLAFAYNNVGNDSEAKKILIKGRIRTNRNPFDLITFLILGGAAKLTIPAWKSFVLLVFFGIFGIVFYSYMGDINGFAPANPKGQMTYSPLWLTVENMLPIPLDTNKNLVLSNKNFEFLKLISPRDIGILHKILSTICLTTFIIGIARITKKEN